MIIDDRCVGRGARILHALMLHDEIDKKATAYYLSKEDGTKEEEVGEAIGTLDEQISRLEYSLLLTEKEFKRLDDTLDTMVTTFGEDKAAEFREALDTIGHDIFNLMLEKVCDCDRNVRAGKDISLMVDDSRVYKPRGIRRKE